MAKCFNTNLASVEYHIGDVVSAMIPPPYYKGKTNNLISVVYKASTPNTDEDSYKMYTIRTPYSIVDRSFAAHKLTLLDANTIRPNRLNEP